MLSKKQIEAIKELVHAKEVFPRNFDYNRRITSVNIKCWDFIIFQERKNGVLTTHSFTVYRRDKSISYKTVKSYVISQKRDEYIPLTLPIKWLAPLAKILEEK